MNEFVMIVLIVLISCGTGVISSYLKTRRLEIKKGGQGAAPDGLFVELDDLRARVEVLEKIVTDEKYQLNTELNRL